MYCFFVCRAVALFFLFLYLVSSRHVLPVQCFPHVLSPLVLTWVVGAARPGVGHLSRRLVDGCCCCFGVVVLPVVGGAVRSIVVVAVAVLVVTAVCFRVHFGVNIQCQPPSQVAVAGGRRGLPLVSTRAPSV